MDNIVLDNKIGEADMGEDEAKQVASYVNKDGVLFAGTHLLIDLWGATNLNSPQQIEETLKECALVCGATILHSHMHHFAPYGVSGVIVLAESHISIHTWPERQYASLDIFMCGTCNPYQSIEILKNYFKPNSVQVSEHKRGIKV
jgi:S-adenosylmethionine decarboxylase